MYDRDELKEIREKLDRKGEEIKDTEKYRFLASFTASLLLAIVILGIAFSQSLVMAITVGGVGGFTAQIDKIQGDDIVIYPDTGESASCPESSYTGDPKQGDSALPLLRGEIGGATVPAGSNVVFSKDIATPNIQDISAVRINVTNTKVNGQLQKVTLDDTTLDLTRLEADSIDLQTNIVIDDRNSANTFGRSTGEFILEGDTVEIQDAFAQIHLLQFSTLQLEGLNIEIEYNPPNPQVPDIGDICQAVPTGNTLADQYPNSNGEPGFGYGIYNVDFGDYGNQIERRSGDPDDVASDGYTDFTDEVAIVQRGTTYDFGEALEVEVDSGASDTCVRAWFDWDGDRNFETTGDSIYDLGCAPSGEVSADITVPSTAETGKTLMRVSAKSSNYPSFDETGFFYGEVQDFTVLVE